MAVQQRTEQRSVVLGPAAASVRRTVGPIAWVVLELLAETSVEIAGQTVSHESVRGLADALDLAKDTVARALRRLAGAGLVAYVASRSDGGRFGPSHYRLTLPPDLFVDLPPGRPPTERKRPVRSPRQPDPSTAAQLSLIDPAPTAS